ncbi:hypothetical protein BRD13_04795 [Halobacteriales archaeon SW_5_70_135]|nr:MAG: hypothetical protein BRD13_04795 [Halobacteriales archaeon SW_5_70_135]
MARRRTCPTAHAPRPCTRSSTRSTGWTGRSPGARALRGVPVEPDDVDVRTTERGAYEARACERLGRDERAALLRAHAEDEH